MSSNQSAAPAAPAAKTPSPWKRVVKYARRSTAVTVNVALLLWLVGHPLPMSLLQVDWGGDVLPAERMPVLILAVWFAFLTQLSIWWALWLPVYLIAFPMGWLLWQAVATIAKPVVAEMRDAGTDPKGPLASAGRRLRLPLRRLWFVALLLYVVARSGLQAQWAAWILPALLLPVWIWLLKFAYRSAVRPRSVALHIVTASNWFLDRMLEPAEPGSPVADPTAARTFNKWVLGCIRVFLRRYSPEALLSVVQREALVSFSASLLLAFIASMAMWGLVARALVAQDASYLEGYSFFSDGRPVECFLWAAGCMTTTLDLPGSAVPFWVRGLHIAAALTGIFHLTYLFGCFSIMVNAEGQRVVDSARKLLEQAQSKLEKAHLLVADEQVTKGPDRDVIEGTVVPNEGAISDAGPRPTSGSPPQPEA